jgi:hypothetical protein
VTSALLEARIATLYWFSAWALARR